MLDSEVLDHSPQREIVVDVIVGEEDTVTPPSDAEALGRGIRNAELTVIARAGHLSALEAPEDFSTTIPRWLASLQ